MDQSKVVGATGFEPAVPAWLPRTQARGKENASL